MGTPAPRAGAAVGVAGLPASGLGGGSGLAVGGEPVRLHAAARGVRRASVHARSLCRRSGVAGSGAADSARSTASRPRPVGPPPGNDPAGIRPLVYAAG